MELGSVQPFLRFFQRDRGTRARRALGGTAREEVKVWSATFISARLRHDVYLTHCAKQQFCCANITQMQDPQQERQRTLGVPPGIIYDPMAKPDGNEDVAVEAAFVLAEHDLRRETEPGSVTENVGTVD